MTVQSFLAEDNDLEAYLYEEIVPGTHVTVNLLSYLLFNKYQMSTPSYRETKNRLADMNWDICRQTLSNWADKGAVQLNKLISALKDVALQTGSDVIDIDHLCCLAHARAKFRKALDQGCGKARYFLLKIGDLYGREEEYRRLDLPPDEIFKRRNDA